MIKFVVSAHQVMGIFLISLFIRFLYVTFLVSPEHLALEDQSIYLLTADKFFKNGIAGWDPERVPGYPVFLTIVYWISSDSVFIVYVQSVVDSLSCVVIGLLTQRTLGAGFRLAGLLSAVNLNMIILSGMILTDSLFLLFFICSLYFVVNFLTKPSLLNYLACIGLLSIATIVRPATYFLIPLTLIGFSAYGLRNKVHLKHALGYFLAGFVLALSILSPQHLRNWRQFGSTSFVSQSGSHLLGWVTPAVHQYSGSGSYEDGQLLARSRLDRVLGAQGFSDLPSDPFIASQLKAQAAKSLLQELGIVAIVKAWAVGALLNAVVPSAAFAPVVRAMEHPSFYGSPGNGVLEKLWYYVTNVKGTLYFSILAAGALTSLVFFILFLGGWLFALRDDEAFGRPIFVSFTLILLYFFLITGPIIGSKYRLPIEPIMTVFVVFGLLQLQERMKRL